MSNLFNVINESEDLPDDMSSINALINKIEGFDFNEHNVRLNP